MTLFYSKLLLISGKEIGKAGSVQHIFWLDPRLSSDILGFRCTCRTVDFGEELSSFIAVKIHPQMSVFQLKFAYGRHRPCCVCLRPFGQEVGGEGERLEEGGGGGGVGEGGGLTCLSVISFSLASCP